MLNSKRQSGFTLVEVTMTLAISGVLILIVFTGQAEIRRRAQFSDAIERVKNSLNMARTQSLTTVNCKLGASCDDGTNGANQNREVMGRELIFDNSKSYIQVNTLLRDTSNIAANFIRVDSERLSYAWGLKFSQSSLAVAPNPTAVVFWRQSSDGRFATSGFACTDPACSASLKSSNYPGTAGNLVLNFTDPSGYTGRETIELPGGAITRSIP